MAARRSRLKLSCVCPERDQRLPALFESQWHMASFGRHGVSLVRGEQVNGVARWQDVLREESLSPSPYSGTVSSTVRALAMVCHFACPST